MVAQGVEEADGHVEAVHTGPRDHILVLVLQPHARTRTRRSPSVTGGGVMAGAGGQLRQLTGAAPPPICCSLLFLDSPE